MRKTAGFTIKTGICKATKRKVTPSGYTINSPAKNSLINP